MLTGWKSAVSNFLALVSFVLGSISTPIKLTGQSNSANTSLDTILQSKTVTIQADEMPVKDFLENFSNQAGYPLSEFGLFNEKVTFTCQNTHSLTALATLAKQKGWKLESVYGEEGFTLQLCGGNPDLPIRGFQSQGPLTLLWFGLTTVKDYNFNDPQHPIENTKYRMSYVQDPMAHMEVGDGKTQVRDIPVVFALKSGKELTLLSDHKKTTFKSGEAWEFTPQNEWKDQIAGIKVTVPFFAATRISKTTLAWKEQTKTEGNIVIKVSNVTSRDEEGRDPKDFFKTFPARTWSIQVHIIHQEATSGKLPLEALLLDGHSATLIGDNGSQQKAFVKRVSGMHGPTVGFTFEVKAQTPLALRFIPKSFEFSWAGDYQTFTPVFEIKE